MKSGLLNKIKGVYPPEIPPDGSEAVGKTDAGQTIYRRRIRPKEKVRALDKDGEPKFKGGNPLTGEEGVPVFKYVDIYAPKSELPENPEDWRAGRDFEWEYFIINRGRHGNNRKIVIDPKALDEERKAKTLRARKDALLERVAGMAAEFDMDLDEAAKKILGIAQSEPEGPQVIENEVDAEDGSVEAGIVPEEGD